MKSLAVAALLLTGAAASVGILTTRDGSAARLRPHAAAATWTLYDGAYDVTLRYTVHEPGARPKPVARPIDLTVADGSFKTGTTGRPIGPNGSTSGTTSFGYRGYVCPYTMTFVLGANGNGSVTGKFTCMGPGGVTVPDGRISGSRAPTRWDFRGLFTPSSNPKDGVALTLQLPGFKWFAYAYTPVPCRGAGPDGQGQPFWQGRFAPFYFNAVAPRIGTSWTIAQEDTEPYGTGTGGWQGYLEETINARITPTQASGYVEIRFLQGDHTEVCNTGRLGFHSARKH